MLASKNVILDQKLVDEALKVTKIKTIKLLIDCALRELLGREKQRNLLKLRGEIHWEGNLELLRKDKD